MKIRADIATCENERDTILSMCQLGPEGIEREVIIQRGPREFEVIEEDPGPKISCEELGLDLVRGPEKITFSGNVMTIVLSDSGNIEVDISNLPRDEQEELKVVGKVLFR